MTLEIDLRQIVYALSDAVDLVGVDDFYHGKRVAMLASEFAGALAMDEDLVFDAGLLHDCGVSSTRVHLHLAGEMEWAGSHEHCVRGAELLQAFAPLSHLAKIVLYHHTRWDAEPPIEADEHTRIVANLIFLADRIDALAIPHYRQGPMLQVGESIRATMAQQKGGMFSPHLVDAFLECSRSEAFWFSLENRHVDRFLAEKARRRKNMLLSFAELKNFALTLAQIVDAKSPFTAEHSLGVGRLARLLAQKSGLQPETCDKVEIAGLLHDIGKLGVPDEILEKKGPLDELERAVMSHHSFESHEILQSIGGLEEIAAWAAYHHERPDGSGYPFHVRGGDLPLEARIVAIADVFQALAQNRPYRGSMAPGNIVEHLAAQAEAGHFDMQLVQLCADNLQECWRAANG